MADLGTNLLEFIGIEETNLLVTMVKCNPEIAKVFPKLDGAYQAPMKFIDVNLKDEHKKTVLALYLYTHYHLYFSTVCLLRCHLSDSLASTRKAIDATLTAYRLIEEPGTLELYEKGDWSYKGIKRFVERARKKDKAKFPLAETLIPLHELCSEFGSHADISSFIHRLSIEEIEGSNKALFKVHMFQTPDTDLELRAYLVQTLLAYTLMAKVFSTFVGEMAAGLEVAAWIEQLDRLENAFGSEAQEIDKQMNSVGTREVRATEPKLDPTGEN